MSCRTLLLCACLFGGSAVFAADDYEGLEDAAQDFKRGVLDLNRDLLVFEEQTLYPADTQLAVFLAMDLGAFFDLDSVRLQLDGREIAQYTYTDPEVDALIRGGTQRLYVGNLADGAHELVGVFTGKGPHGREYRRGVTLNFDKGRGQRLVELRIVDSENRQQPEFAARVWP